MEPFEIIDVSGDVGLKAFGKTVEEAFANAASGMYSLITDPKAVEEKKILDVSAAGDSLDSLLVSWLNELIFHFDAYGFIGGKIVISELNLGAVEPAGPSDYKIKASLSGEEFDAERHESRLLIKAATYHKLKIEKKDDMWEIDVIFDI
ncbi:MAG: archease [Nitrospirota bacterium]